MNFDEAIHALIMGHHVRRAAWPYGLDKLHQLSHGLIVIQQTPVCDEVWHPTEKDRLAEDWEVVELDRCS